MLRLGGDFKNVLTIEAKALPIVPDAAKKG